MVDACVVVTLVYSGVGYFICTLYKLVVACPRPKYYMLPVCSLKDIDEIKSVSTITAKGNTNEE